MQMGPGRVAKHYLFRFLGRVLLLFIAIGQVQTAMAEQTVSISPSVVLVLKLVSSTLVKPTTGIVISDDGMVLVPAEFAAEKGEMIVLDGGADILSNGRPASLVAGDGPADMAILSVKGLKRPGIKLSGNVIDKDSVLHLEAFPPAEYIAKGAQPLKLPVKVMADGLNSTFSVAPQTPLPYVTGAILDTCGNLVGVSLTSGPQSLDSGQVAPTLFNDDLRRVFASMQIDLPSAVCERPVVEAVTPAVTKTHSDPPPATEKTRAPVAENNPDNAVEADALASTDNQPPETPDQEISRRTSSAGSLGEDTRTTVGLAQHSRLACLAYFYRSRTSCLESYPVFQAQRQTRWTSTAFRACG